MREDYDGSTLFNYAMNTPDSEYIINDWLHMADKGVAATHDPKPYSRCYQGIQAPMPDRLEIKGSWITTGNIEYVEASKRDRDPEIFMFGFS